LYSIPILFPFLLLIDNSRRSKRHPFFAIKGKWKIYRGAREAQRFAVILWKVVITSV
jgi:hypothetical protein